MVVLVGLRVRVELLRTGLVELSATVSVTLLSASSYVLVTLSELVMGEEEDVRLASSRRLVVDGR